MPITNLGMDIPSVESLILKGLWNDDSCNSGQKSICLDGRVHPDGIRAVELGDTLNKIADYLGKDHALYYAVFYDYPSRPDGPRREIKSSEEMKATTSCSFIEMSFFVVIDSGVLEYAQQSIGAKKIHLVQPHHKIA